MNNTLILVLASIIILLLLLPLLFFLRRRVELKLEKDILVLDFPLSTKKIDLDKELNKWNVQNAHYVRWGIFSTINMYLNNGKRISVSSMFNQSNYDQLHKHLRSRFQDRREPSQYF